MLANLNDVLKPAQAGHYAVGLFNAIDGTMLEAVLTAAEHLRAPVIIGTAEALLKYGELSLIAPSMIAAASRASVPVVVHFDHGLTYGRCVEALKLGFTSIMFDGSAGTYAYNIERTREIVKMAHAFGATVEGEIGHVGEAENTDQSRGDLYTTPEDAVRYAEDTGVDALAVAIGTAHGVYKTTPHLDIERLAAIRKALDTPLVLHGGSGLSDSDFRATVREGITKINIFTDLDIAGTKGQRAALAENMSYCDVRNTVREYITEAAMHKIKLFGSDGKA